MNITQQAITGGEAPPDQQSAFAALARFYQAFNGRDFALMQANWLPSPAASMANPLGGIKRGWQEIASVYQRIFAGPARVYVEFYDYSLHETPAMFVAAGRERGFLQIADTRLELAIRTSRTYVRQDGQWRQLHHHGSMDNPELLQAYQSALTPGRRAASHG